MPLLDDGDGLAFECPCAEEAEFLYEEIFVRRSYLQEGVDVPRDGAPTIVDLGANIGLFALLALRLNPSARIVAVEPAPPAFRALERNLSHAPSARCVRLLVRERGGEAALHCFASAPGESTCHPRERRMQRARLASAVRRGGGEGLGRAAGGGGGDEEPSAAVRVRAVTLSSLLEQMGVHAVDLLKVDVEGDELRVLRGISSARWPTIRQVVVEVHDINHRLGSIRSLLRRHGFRVRSLPQHGGVVQGYNMVIPEELRLWYVYATRPSTANSPARTLCPRRRKRARSDHGSSN
ncbi:hypothetical protein AB1Y20_006921 [Prymnesium parvum]|uniref:Methyltransferase FkbM domain-containing protein n=1 Tax=Prymnesium parvum TaxID=97485 RepID=A0AB34J243_PRYPA